MPKIICLIGLPGSGKTYWGHKIASNKNIPFLDLDDIIVKESGMTISEIMNTGGEQLFRKIETNLLAEIISQSGPESFVLSLGGGTPAFNNNMMLINQYCCSIYLNIEIDIVAQHLINDNLNHRPLIQKTSDIEEIKKYLFSILSEREVYYQLADYMIFHNELSIANFDKIINDCDE